MQKISIFNIFISTIRIFYFKIDPMELVDQFTFRAARTPCIHSAYVFYKREGLRQTIESHTFRDSLVGSVCRTPRWILPDRTFAGEFHRQHVSLWFMRLAVPRMNLEDIGSTSAAVFYCTPSTLRFDATINYWRCAVSFLMSVKRYCRLIFYVHNFSAGKFAALRYESGKL